MNPSNRHAEPVVGHAADVRDFLQQLKNKNPDEVLGSGANHSLGTALLQATVITLAMLILLTVGPLVYNQAAPAAKATPADAEVKPPIPEPSKPVTPAPTPAAVSPSPAPTTTTTPPDKEFLNKIGATETKKANPKVNPLEKTTDDLFKDIDKK